MAKYTKEDIFHIVEEEDVRFVKLQFTDMYGMPKNVNLPIGQLEKALSGQAVFDGSSIEGFIRKDEDDMLLHPDLDTFKVFPVRGRDGATARFICDIYQADGKPFEGDPRYVLKKVIKKAREKGIYFRIKPELEFFLFQCDDEGNPTTNNPEVASYFDMSTLDFGEGIRNEMVIFLEEMGYMVESSHHETSPGQHEIDFEEKSGLDCADALATSKILIKMIARRSGMHATFMPKPKEGVNGSGLHISMSMVNEQGDNLFIDESDIYGLSEDAYAFMEGVLRHIYGMSLILNPLVNSYKRITPGYDAPVDISWSAGTNRGSFMRVSSFNKNNPFIELRSPDPSCNPYLALALILAAGLDGLEHRSCRPKEGLSFGSLPKSLSDAMDAYREDGFIKSVLGETIYNKYLEAKLHEWNGYKKQVTPWEVQEYLYKY